MVSAANMAMAVELLNCLNHIFNEFIENFEKEDSSGVQKVTN